MALWFLSQPTLSTFKLRPKSVSNHPTTHIRKLANFLSHYYEQMKRYGVEEPENLLSSAINNQNILFFLLVHFLSGNTDSVKNYEEHYQDSEARKRRGNSVFIHGI